MTKHITNFSQSAFSTVPEDATDITAADAMELVTGWADLTDQRRRDLRSALATLAAMAGHTPDQMWLTPQAVRSDVPTQSAVAHGFSDARLKNIFSAVRYVLRRLGVIAVADGPTSPAWEAALAMLEKRQGDGMRGLARFCAAREIGPEAVDPDTLVAFAAHLAAQTIKPEPDKYVGKLRGRWNRACRQVAGWPGHTLPVPRDPNQFILPLSAFPAPFQADLALFGEEMAESANEPVADDDADDEAIHPSRPLQRRARAATTVALRQNHARWAASALVGTGVPIAEVTSLAALVTPLSRARGIIRHLWERADRSGSAAGMHVAEVLRIVAKYHVGLPPKECARIRGWGDKVAVKYKQMTPKNWTQMQEMMDPARERALLELPGSLMAAARDLRATSPGQARALALRGVAIHLLLRTRLRLDNLLALRPDRHLVRTLVGDTRISQILVPLSETKNEHPVFLPASANTAAILQEWIDDFRPLVAAPECPYLFPGHGTGRNRMTPQGLRDAVKSTMAHHVGVPLSPQRFRHLCAAMHLRAHPGEYQTVGQLLGHTSPVTAVRSYSGIEAAANHRRFDTMTDARRDELRKDPQNKPARPTPQRRKVGP